MPFVLCPPPPHPTLPPPAGGGGGGPPIAYPHILSALDICAINIAASLRFPKATR